MGATNQNENGRRANALTTPTTSANDSALVHVRGGERVIDSRTIARELDRRHDNVLQTLESLIADGTLGPLDFKETSYSDQWNRQQPCYELTERGALVAMPFIGGRRSREGQARLVDAFMALRTAASASSAAPQLPDFTNPVLAARAWANEREQKQAHQLTIEQQAPAVEFAHTVRNMGDSIDMGDMARIIGWGRNRLFRALRVDGILMEGRLPYQKYMDCGYFRVIEGTRRRPDGSVAPTFKTCVTGKGQVFVQRRYGRKAA